MMRKALTRRGRRCAAIVAALVALVIPRAAGGQALSVLHIKVVLIDAERRATPVPRHALLISDNPATASPRRVVTALDGGADVRLPPGNYTVESDRAVAFEGRAYEWTQTLDIRAGRDASLELTNSNAQITAVTAETTSLLPSIESDPSALLRQWQDSVVALWTPTAHASGFLVDASGLIVTNQRAIGAATSVEVQVTRELKVAGTVVAKDAARDVAVVRIDPAVMASVKPVPLGCAAAPGPVVTAGQEIFTIGTPLREVKGLTSGTVSRVEPHAIVSDLRLALGDTGGPVFAANGSVIGITAGPDGKDDSRRANAGVVRIEDACAVVAWAATKLTAIAPPKATPLPVEPLLPFPVDALKDAAARRAGNLPAYQTSSSDFDITFITPVLAHGDRMEFGNWSEYVADVPPVLLVRVTPKLVENFWTTVARGAAQTQGVALPPIKHYKPGFSRMRAFCGDTEVTPIHPFTIEKRVSDTRVVDPKVLTQVWQDFAPYRALK